MEQGINKSITSNQPFIKLSPLVVLYYFQINEIIIIIEKLVAFYQST